MSLPARPHRPDARTPGRWSRLHKGAAVATLAVAVIGGFEGLRLVAYRDVVGVKTICYGSTKGVELGMTRSKEECDTLLLADAIEHEEGMRACLSDPDALPPETYTAFLSFTFNLGVGAFCNSTLRRKIEAGDVAGACDELPKWNRAGGREIAGLTKRRAKERELCHDGLLKKRAETPPAPGRKTTDVRFDIRHAALVVDGDPGHRRAPLHRLVLSAAAPAGARAARGSRRGLLHPQERRAGGTKSHRGQMETRRAGDAR